MPTDHIRLNLFDRWIIFLERSLSRRGQSGLHGSILLLFRGRVDLSQLQESVDRLVTRWPPLTARLMRKPKLAWVPTGCRTMPIQQLALDSDSDEELVQVSQQLRSVPFELDHQDPLRLALLHRPGGDDVLCVQASHVLFDVHSGIAMVKQLLDPSQIPPQPDEEDSVLADPFTAMMAKHSLGQRLAALWGMLRQWRKTHPVTFPGLKKVWPKHLVCGPTSLRWLDEETTNALEARLQTLGSFVSPNLAAAASGFRTLHKFVGKPNKPNDIYELALPYNLRRGKEKQVPYHNFAQRMFLTARPDQLDDREQLILLLAAQFREQISRRNQRLFLAQAQGVSFMVQLSEKLPWVMPLLKPARTRCLRIGYSPDVFGHGKTYLGAVLDGFLVTQICCAPLGASLDLFKIGKRLLLSFMHTPEALTDQQASKFFADWVDDLCRP